MFEATIRDAKHAVNSVMERALEGVIVGVAFLVSLAFATAALTLYLTDLYGARIAYMILAVIFAVLGVVAVVAAKKPSEPAAEAESAATEAQQAAERQSPGGGGISLPADLGSIAALIASNPRFALGGLRYLFRNVTLVALLALMATLMLSERRPAAGGMEPPQT